MDNIKLKETIKELKNRTMTNALNKGNNRQNELPEDGDDLVDHFRNFDLDELGQSIPKSAEKKFGESGNLHFNQRVAELQSENEGLKQIIETMAKDMEQIR